MSFFSKNKTQIELPQLLILVSTKECYCKSVDDNFRFNVSNEEMSCILHMKNTESKMKMIIHVDVHFDKKIILTKFILSHSKKTI